MQQILKQNVAIDKYKIFGPTSNLLMSLFCSTSKHGQVVYQGAVRELEEVTKSLDSIGPEVIQTLSVSTIHSLFHRCIKSYLRMIYVCLGFLPANVLQLDEFNQSRQVGACKNDTFSRAFHRLHVFPR